MEEREYGRGKCLQIIIEDDGCGVEQEIINQRFVSGGLNHVKDIIKSMKGEFHIYSEKSAGSQMCITIPVII